MINLYSFQAFLFASTGSIKTISKIGGSWVLKLIYDSSLFLALKDVYPEYDWMPWKFNSGANKRFWKETENRKKFFDWIGKELKIEKMEDWSKIDFFQFKKVSGNPALSSLKIDSANFEKSLSRNLSQVYFDSPFSFQKKKQTIKNK